MNLAAQQRKFLELFRSTYQMSVGDDEYIQTVAQSKHLREAQRNILLWRVYVLERTCALSFRLLKRLNLLEVTLNSFIKKCNISPFRETQALAFWESLSNHGESLIASVAQFELALFRIRQGDPGSYIVLWTVEPYAVLHSLATDSPLKSGAAGMYKMLISCNVPSEFVVVAEKD